MAGKVAGIESDKLAHAAAGFAGQVICEAAANKLFEESSGLAKSIGCLMLVNGLGALKEATDKSRGGTPEFADMGANLIGSGLAVPIIKIGF